MFSQENSARRTTPLVAALAISILLAVAAGAQTVTVGTKSVRCGESVTVPVTVTTVSGMEAIQFDVGYTASKLQPKDVTTGSLTSGGLVGKNFTGSLVKVAIALSGAKSGSGTVANISFTASASATGTVSLPISAILINDVARTGVAGSVTITCPQAPAAPTLKSPADGASSVSAPVTLQWNAAAEAEKYQVYFGTPTAKLIGTTTNTSMLVETATGTTYEWYVRAENDAGTSPSSAKRTFTTSGPFCATPVAPSISAPGSSASGSSYTVSWDAVANATEYVLEEAGDASFTAATSITLAATSTSFTKTVNAAATFYYRVRARNTAGGCSVNGSTSPAAAVAVTPRPPIPAGGAVLIVVSSTPGGFGASFRTSLQLHNPTGGVLRGRIVFHPAGSSGGDSDPALVFELQPGQTISYNDLLPAMGIASGVGSVDIVPDAGHGLPLSVTRVFNDAGAAGTSGLTLEPLGLDDILYAGQTGVIVAPLEPARMRMNIGIRALADGASISARMRDRNGGVVATRDLSFPPVFFNQVSAEALMGEPLPADATLSFTVTAGSALIYGSTTDNVTNDPSVQIARPVE